jgi:hypothetical protein
MLASSLPSSTTNFTLARDWGHLRRQVKSLSNEVTRLQSRLLETQKLLQQREETIKKLLEHRRKKLWRWLWPRAARWQECSASAEVAAQRLENTAEDGSDAVAIILSAIEMLTEEQRSRLFQTLTS